MNLQNYFYSVCVLCQIVPVLASLVLLRDLSQVRGSPSSSALAVRSRNSHPANTALRECTHIWYISLNLLPQSWSYLPDATRHAAGVAAGNCHPGETLGAAGAVTAGSWYRLRVLRYLCPTPGVCLSDLVSPIQ